MANDLYTSSSFWVPLDFEDVCTNWITNRGGLSIAPGASASVMRQLAEAINHLNRTQCRIFFNRTDNSKRFDNIGTNFLRWVYPDYGPVLKDHVIGYLYDVSKVASGAWAISDLPYITCESGTPVYYQEDVILGDSQSSGHEIGDLFDPQSSITNGDAYGNLLLTLNGNSTFFLEDVVVQEQLGERLGGFGATGTNQAGTFLAKEGKHILSDALEDVRSKFHELRSKNLPFVLDWNAESCEDTNQADLIEITSTSFVNIIDQSINTRTVASPGAIVICYAAGRGNSTTTNVEVRTLAYVDSGTTGQIRFMGPNANVTLTITRTSIGWDGDSGDYVEMNTDIDYDYVTDTDINKIDVHAKVDTGSMYIAAVKGWMQYC